MKVYEENNINDLYYNVIKDVFYNGKTFIKQNGDEIREIVPATLVIKNPKECVITHPGRPYNIAFMCAETIWNLCAKTDFWLCDYNAEYKKYFKNNRLEAGYGNRIFNSGVNQFEKVVDLLQLVPDNSHCTISIFDKEFDLNGDIFVPCITFIKFRVNNGKLDMFTHMRAQDLWKGFPYDINLLVSLFECMCICSGYDMGTYYHVCDALRLYKKDYSDIKSFIKITDYKNFQPISIELPKNNMWEKLSFYEKIISDTQECNEVDLQNEPNYCRNMLLCCIIYKNIKKKNYKKALTLMNSLEQEYKNQIIIWAKRYNNKFYNTLEVYNGKQKKKKNTQQ